MPLTLKTHTKMSCCGHCAKGIGSKSSHSCGMCGKATYCSAVCAHDDWTLHQVECNTVQVPTKDAIVAVPSAFQDVLAEKYFNESDRALVSQGFVMKHHASNGVVSQRVQSPLGTQGRTTGIPPKRQDHKDYHIEVNQKTMVKGNTLQDAIYARAPGAGGQLAKTRAKVGFTLWKNVPASNAIAFPMSESFVCRVAVPELDESHIMTVVVPELYRYTDQYKSLSRRARGAVEQQLKLKGLSQNYTDVLPMVAQDAQGRVARFLFDVKKPHEARLIDIEYELPTQTQVKTPVWTEQRFACKATEQDQVMGLMTAVRDRIDYGKREITQYKEEHGHVRNNEAMQQKQDQLEGLESDLRIVAEHYQNYFVDKKSTQISPDVRSAIHRLTQDQLKNVDAILNPVSFMRKPLTEMFQKVDDWISQYLENVPGPKKERGITPSFRGGLKSRRARRRIANNALNKLRIARRVLERIKNKGVHLKYEVSDEEMATIDEKLDQIKQLFLRGTGMQYNEMNNGGVVVSTMNQ